MKGRRPSSAIGFLLLILVSAALGFYILLKLGILQSPSENGLGGSNLQHIQELQNEINRPPQ